MLGIEPKTLHKLGKHSTTNLQLLSHFHSLNVIFYSLFFLFINLLLMLLTKFYFIH
jgi:hypothetical protein